MFLNKILVITIFLNNYPSIITEDINYTTNIIYPGKIKRGVDLVECEEREVCSIVHKRFWFPGQTEQFCRCNGNECPLSWSDTPNNVTMMLNNRSQMKFCKPITDLPNCVENGTLYLYVKNYTNTETSIIKNYYFQIKSRADCYCPPHNKWIPNSYQRNESESVTSFRCTKLDKCYLNDFCGMERADYFSVYYRCSCPTGSLCVKKDKLLYPVMEMFYSGHAYKAHCVQFPYGH